MNVLLYCWLHAAYVFVAFVSGKSKVLPIIGQGFGPGGYGARLRLDIILFAIQAIAKRRVTEVKGLMIGYGVEKQGMPCYIFSLEALSISHIIFVLLILVTSKSKNS